MQVQVTGRHIEIGEALQTYVTDRLQGMTEKYLENAIEASMTIDKQGHLFIVACSLHAGHGLYLQASASHDDVYGAVEQAADKLEKQLRRYKRRITNHHRRNQKSEVPPLPAQSYVLADEGEGPEEEPDNDDDDQPVIIAETKTEIRTLSVRDAVMMMDLTESPALMFRDRASGRLNMVYRKPDGNVGWVDPEASAG